MEYLSVSAINKYLNFRFENDKNLNNVYVKGEISNFKRHSRGTIYFTLKDENSSIQAMIFSSAQNIDFELHDGLSVLIEGKISIYEAYGTYQINVRNIILDGIGKLYLEYDKLKKELLEKGYFDKSHKRPIKKFNNNIGVITSKTGSVIKDIINTVNRRFPLAKITLYPASVQGERSKDEIISCINKANKENLVDVIIVARGGGSIEDLWSFNLLEVALAIYNSKIPVVSAIGHETDFTIADFVSDLRAPTPTAAAELVTPNIIDLKMELKDLNNSLNKNIVNYFDDKNMDLSYLESRLDNLSPQKRLLGSKNQYNELVIKLNSNYKNYIEFIKNDFLHIKNNLAKISLTEYINNKKIELNDLMINSKKNINLYFEQLDNNYNSSIEKLEALNPLKVMKRGFVVLSDGNKMIKSVKKIKIGDQIDIKLIDGKIKGRVDEIDEL